MWRRISAFELDAQTGSAPFSAKLAQTENWSDIYTKRVIEEYRRFLYLTQVSEMPVTPSKVVDRAWHMHLTFTRNYWEALCGDLLGGPLHHDPCEGAEHMPRYQAQFAHTMALYREEFGGLPPADIWCDPHVKRKLTIVGLAVCAGGAMIVAAKVIPGVGHPGLMMWGGLLLLAGGGLFAILNLPASAGSAKAGTQGAATVGGCGSGGGCGGGGCGGGGC